MSEQNADPVRELIGHLIDEHGYEQAYFDGFDPPLTLMNLRWLHAPQIKSREFPKGCDGRA